MTEQVLRIETIGENTTPLWGVQNLDRVRRIAVANGWRFGAGAGPAVTVDLAYAFDPVWLRHIADRPGSRLTFGGATVIANDGGGGDTFAAEDEAGILNGALRKRERPFVMPLSPATARTIERASYFGAYKGVTDILTKYLWPEWALVLTRLAARFGVTPNMVTAVGAILCVAATILFWHGEYWTGMALGLGFMVLDTVDGKLARCTITSSKWGNVFDHGIDLVHPPFWWWAWGVGLAAYGTPVSSTTFWWLMAVIQGGYLVQRLIEGWFIGRFGIHIHVWRKIDSDFRLITARRNPNMVILFGSMIFQRPDLGLIGVALWTLISLVVHAAQVIQAEVARARGQPIVSWLS